MKNSLIHDHASLICVYSFAMACLNVKGKMVYNYDIITLHLISTIMIFSLTKNSLLKLIYRFTNLCWVIK